MGKNEPLITGIIILIVGFLVIIILFFVILLMLFHMKKTYTSLIDELKEKIIEVNEYFTSLKK